MQTGIGPHLEDAGNLAVLLPFVQPALAGEVVHRPSLLICYLHSIQMPAGAAPFVVVAYTKKN